MEKTKKVYNKFVRIALSITLGLFLFITFFSLFYIVLRLSKYRAENTKMEIVFREYRNTENVHNISPKEFYKHYDFENSKSFKKRILRINLARNIMILSLVGVYIVLVILYRQVVFHKLLIKHNEDLIMLGNASANLAHEIKNPVSSINLQVKYLKKTHPELDDDLSIIGNECNNITLLVDKIREFISNPHGVKEKIDLIGFIEQVLVSFKNHNVVLNNNCGYKKVIVNFDNIRLKSVLENIITNAIEAQDGDTVNAPIEIYLNLIKDKKIKIDIIDKGKGIDMVHKKMLFAPYWTTKTKGTGLGLYLCRRFVEANNGKINLENRKDGKKGAICSIMLDCIIK